MKRMVLLGVFALCAGCAVRQARTSPQKTITTQNTVTTSFKLQNPDLSRKITLDELDKPIRFEAPDVEIDQNAPAVTREDLIGKWESKTKTTVRFVDIMNRNEDVKSTELASSVEFKPDGTCVMDDSSLGLWAYDGALLRISWKDGVKSLRMMWSKDGRILQWFDGDHWNEMVKSWQEKESTAQRDVRYSPLVRDSTLCWRYHVSMFRKGTFEELCRWYLASGPAVLSRIDGKTSVDARSSRSADVSRALSAERKKNLDSLLKAGVITEEEYKKELGKAAK